MTFEGLLPLMMIVVVTLLLMKMWLVGSGFTMISSSPAVSIVDDGSSCLNCKFSIFCILSDGFS